MTLILRKTRSTQHKDITNTAQGLKYQHKSFLPTFYRTTHPNFEVLLNQQANLSELKIIEKLSKSPQINLSKSKQNLFNRCRSVNYKRNKPSNNINTIDQINIFSNMKISQMITKFKKTKYSKSKGFLNFTKTKNDKFRVQPNNAMQPLVKKMVDSSTYFRSHIKRKSYASIEKLREKVQNFDQNNPDNLQFCQALPLSKHSKTCY